MNPTKRKGIQKFAEEMYNYLQLQIPELQIPVDAKVIARKLGGTVIETSTDLTGEIDARIEKVGDSFKIILNANNLDTRSNFTIAHELGHLFLHMGYMVDLERWKNINKYTDSVYYRFGSDEEELEANEFAAAFLMPEKTYRETVEKFTVNDFCQISNVANSFNVSKEAALNRGRWLGIFPWE